MLTKNDLLVLGLLLDRPMHGYEINQHIENEGITTWYNISTAAIYNSLNKLHRQKLISETRSRGGGPEKSVYHLTKKGREQFFVGMETALASETPVRFEYDLGIFLLNKLPQDQALTLLEQRLGFIQHWHATLTQTMEQESLADNHPLRAAILEHGIAFTQMEAEWLADIIHQTRGSDVERRRGLMILKGELHEFHLPDLVKLVVSGKHSGTLTVTDGSSTRTLSFQEGRPVCATSYRLDEPVHEPEQITNDIYDLFRWQEGKFVFDQRMEPKEDCLILDTSAEDLILAGIRWVDNWATIQRVVPSPDTVFDRREDLELAKELSLTKEERQVLEMLDGIRDITDIARACRLTEFETSKILYGFQVVGLVQPGNLDKIRLRRLFRELVELTCQGTLPHRSKPDDVSCELEVNERCTGLPIQIINGRIQDRTDPKLRIEELTETYRSFIQTQHIVIQERFGTGTLQDILRQVHSQIGPGLQDMLDQFSLSYQ